MIALALEALAASTALMLLVLALRGPVRRLFGAEMAYLLWALPGLRLMLPPLPSDWNLAGATPMSGVGEQALELVAPVAPVDVAVSAPANVSGDLATWLALLWAAGAFTILAFQTAQYLRFRARVLGAAQAIARVGSVEVVESAGASGPLAFGLIRRVVAFPRDFAERYDAQERELALAHEIGHHRRGDLWANWVALVLLALHWFNPVAWVAFRAFRADQEMANDAGVLAKAGLGVRHAYGCAIVKAAHGRALTPACHLNTVNDLKGRLRMLARGRVSRQRIAAGGTVVVLVAGAGLVLTASGMPAAARVRESVERVTGVRLDTLDHDVAVGLAPAVRTRKTSKVTIVEHGRTTVLRADEAAAYIAAHPVPVPPVPPVPPMPSVPDVTGRPPAAPMPPVPPAVPPYSAQSVSVGGETCGGGSAIVTRSRSGHQVVICSGAGSVEVREAMRAAREAQREAAATDREARLKAMAAGREARLEAMQASREAQHEAFQARREAQREAMIASRDAMRTALSSLATTRSSLAANAQLTGAARATALREIDAAIAEVKRDRARDN